MRTDLIDHDYTIPLSDWVASLPQGRSVMTAAGYYSLLRYMLEGGQVPYYTDPRTLAADFNLARENEMSALQRRMEYAEVTAARSAPAIKRIWGLVYAAHPRKTMSVADVRAALQSEGE